MTAPDPLCTTRDSAQAFEDRLTFFADQDAGQVGTHTTGATLIAALESRGCGACWACEPSYQFMRVCSTCGNKRCPHANDHTNACTGSNVVRQAGSAYEHGSGAATTRRFAARVAHGYQDEAR